MVSAGKGPAAFGADAVGMGAIELEYRQGLLASLFACLAASSGVRHPVHIPTHKANRGGLSSNIKRTDTLQSTAERLLVGSTYMNAFKAPTYAAA